MSVAITIQIEGLEALEARLDRLAAIEFSALLEEVGALATSVAQERITATKRAPDGGTWAPWSAGYAKRRRSQATLLQDEGHLWQSIQHLVTGDRVAVGSNLAYAGVHQKGSSKSSGRGGGIPARPYLGVGPEEEQAIQLLAHGFISDLLA